MVDGFRSSQFRDHGLFEVFGELQMSRGRSEIPNHRGEKAEEASRQSIPRLCGIPAGRRYRPFGE